MKSLVLMVLLAGRIMEGQGCGVQPHKPYVPYGCKDLNPLCTCDVNGQNCTWQWVCVK